jgi:NADPH-dependent 2,4-dienoyl-CoA reductase/sulfur reductase-like enzyme
VNKISNIFFFAVEISSTRSFSSPPVLRLRSAKHVISSTKMSKLLQKCNGHHICVVGAGIVGISTARSLRRRGFKVSIVAADHSLSSKVASQGAGGLW